ncbi:hypothetical protein ES705_15561 [subsurface metagenome]
MKGKRKLLSVHLADPSLFEKFKERAWKERRSMSEIVREMIEEYLKKNPRKHTVGKSRKK